MRTTVTLDDDLVARLKDLAHRTGVSFKELLNTMIRRGLASQERPESVERFTVEPHHGGFRPGIDPARLNQLLDELEASDFEDTSSR